MIESGSRSRSGRRREATTALQALVDGPGADPVRRALWLEALDLRLRPLLPPGLAAHAQLANVDGSKLVYLVDAPAWNARLRLATTPLLDAARSIGLDVTHLVIKTRRAPLPPRSAPQRQVRPMSQASRTALDSALASLRESPETPPARTRRK
ncbi:MAG: DciA family protein [Pseudoxanthomonas suwonensis]|nr:DciA family protein [Pseudoxanthomonas suwonensis]